MGSVIYCQPKSTINIQIRMEPVESNEYLKIFKSLYYKLYSMYYLQDVLQGFWYNIGNNLKVSCIFYNLTNI